MINLLSCEIFNLELPTLMEETISKNHMIRSTESFVLKLRKGLIKKHFYN